MPCGCKRVCRVQNPHRFIVFLKMCRDTLFSRFCNKNQNILHMNFFIKQFIQDKKSNMSFEHFYVACLEGDYPMVEQLYNGFSLAEKSRAIVCAIVRGHWGSVDWIFLANKPSAERLLQYLYTCCADGKLIELKQLINSKYSFQSRCKRSTSISICLF